MAERPILFSAPMVRAILAGQKTQTRRLLTPQPVESLPRDEEWTGITAHYERGWRWRNAYAAGDVTKLFELIAHRGPYGQPGDRLWVREAWRTASSLDALSPYTIGKKAREAGYEQCWAPITWEADGAERDWEADFQPTGIQAGRLRPSLHMPRWASRLTLEVTSVRVERLQGITEDDARAEGCDGNCPVGYIPAWQKAPCSYHYAWLWDEINGKRSPWASNPLVWVVSFKRLEVSP